MISLTTKVKVLYEILIDLNISQFLVSNEFKILLVDLEFDAIWLTITKEVKGKISKYSNDGKNAKQISEKVLLLVLNKFHEEDKIQKFIFNLLSKFMEINDQKLDFTGLLKVIADLDFDSKENNQLFTNSIKGQLKFHHSNSDTEEIDNLSDTPQINKRIFIAHGHNHHRLEAVARLIHQQDLTPIILMELPNKGMTVIEKFEVNSESDFAIILLTGDDKGSGAKEKLPNSRARQNVVFEMGYFFAKLGRQNVVCLYEEGVELPSDIYGILYIKLDDAGLWKFKLIKEMRHAGFEVTADII